VAVAQYSQSPERACQYLDGADEPTLRELAEVTASLERLVGQLEELAVGLSRGGASRAS
jgi:hypothetical protein